MQIAVEEHEKALVIRLGGHLGHSSVDQVGRVFNGWLDKGRLNFIIDMTGLQYVSSAGLRFFYEESAKVNSLKGKLILCGMQAAVKQVFDVSGFTSFFSICATIPNALKQV